MTYTLAQLQNLRECLKINNGSIASAIAAFLLQPQRLAGGIILEWVRFAEEIKTNPNFPEEHFTKNHPKPITKGNI